MATLSINYRTPQEVMAEAEPVIRAVLPDAGIEKAVDRYVAMTRATQRLAILTST